MTSAPSVGSSMRASGRRASSGGGGLMMCCCGHGAKFHLGGIDCTQADIQALAKVAGRLLRALGKQTKAQEFNPRMRPEDFTDAEVEQVDRERVKTLETFYRNAQRGNLK